MYTIFVYIMLSFIVRQYGSTYICDARTYSSSVGLVQAYPNNKLWWYSLVCSMHYRDLALARISNKSLYLYRGFMTFGYNNWYI